MLSISTTGALQAARDTRWFEVAPGAIAHVPRVFSEQFSPQPAMIIADQNTFTAAGRAVDHSLRAAGISTEPPFVFDDPNLYAEHRFVERLEGALTKHHAIPIACGSGTINDLVKLSAHRTGRQYLCVATAASMDGYAAFGASITYQGSKQTFSCPAPKAVVADLDVMCRAPAEMSAWGYADLLAKVPAGADWILADAVGAEAIHLQAWNTVQAPLREMLVCPQEIRAGSEAAVGKLVEGLMLAGLAMQAAQSSRPASGAEHQFSHLWDMQHHTLAGRAPSHGFKVGIATLAVTALYEEILRAPLDTLDVDRCCAAWPDLPAAIGQAKTLLGEDALVQVAIQELSVKHCDRSQLRSQLQRLREIWPALRVRLQHQLLPLAVMREKLRAVGAPVEPEQIGISRERLRRSFWQAYFIRRRFTVLDLAVRTGLLDTCLDRILGDRPANGGER